MRKTISRYSLFKKRFVFLIAINILVYFPIFAQAYAASSTLPSHHPIHDSAPHWSSSFTSLNAFMQQVLVSNPAMQAADANVEAAEARQRAASQPLYNPSLTAEGQDAIDHTYSVGINQTIDWSNKRGARAQVGSVNVIVAKASRSVLYQQLMTEVLDALARYQTAEKSVALAKQRTSLLQQFVTLTTKRHASGDVARVDVDLAQLALAQGLAQQADAEVTLSQALQTLLATTGLTEATWPKLPSVLPSPTLTHVDTDELVDNLPVIYLLNNQYLSAASRIRLAEKERHADPTIGIQAGRENTNEGNSSLVSLNLSIPLNIRNNYHNEVVAANDDAIEAEKQQLNKVRQARADIQTSAQRYQIFHHSVQEWQSVSSKPLNSGMELIEKLWQAGEMSTTDYLVQLKQRIDSQISGVELQGRAWQAWIDWLRASGTIEHWVENHTHQPKG